MYKQPMLWSALLIFSAAPSVIFAQGAFSIVNAGGRCLDVSKGSGNRVQIWDCHGGGNQHWRLSSGGQVTNLDGECMEIDPAQITHTGAKIQIGPCNESAGQQWKLDATGRLINANGRCLDIHAPDLYKRGGKVQVWDCTTALNQRWWYLGETQPRQTAARPVPPPPAHTPARPQPVPATVARPAPPPAVARRVPPAQPIPPPVHPQPAPAAKPASPLPTRPPARPQPQAAPKPVHAFAPPAPAQLQVAPPTHTPQVNVNAVTEAPAPFTGIVGEHNRWRQEVGVAPLTWSEKVAAYAREWADTLQTQHGNERFCGMRHRMQNRIYGENLAGGFGGLSPTQAANMWAGERLDYDYASNNCKPGKVCGHYTQMVWAASTEMGCGQAQCMGGSVVWVCNYNPPGNFMGRKPY